MTSKNGLSPTLMFNEVLGWDRDRTDEWDLNPDFLVANYGGTTPL